MVEPSIEETWNSVVSLDRYPITKIGSPERNQLIEQCQQMLKARGACELENFITPDALSTMVWESQQIEAYAFRNALTGNAYLEETNHTLSDDHPKRMEETTLLGVLAYDEIPRAHLLRKLYEWNPLMTFIGEVLGLEQIHRYADPMSALNLSVMIHEDYLRWHFDQSDFVTSLAIQMPETGGAFEYSPMLRTGENENFDGVREVLQGTSHSVHILPNKPGSLVLFMGRYSMHRVTRIEGSRSRLIALLSYDSKPDMKSSDYLRNIRYGRTEIKQGNL